VRWQRGSGQRLTGGRVGVMVRGGIAEFQELEVWDVIEVTKYYAIGGQRIALRRSGVLYYMHTDHLSSTSVLTDAAGNEVVGTRLKYYPYGDPRPATQAGTHNAFATGYSDATFTGQRRDVGTGLYFYGARYYDSAIGRFISPDTIVPNPGNLQALNRYSYALNNPLKYTDPSGHNPVVWCLAGGCQQMAWQLAQWGTQVSQWVNSLIVQYGPQLSQLGYLYGDKAPVLLDKAGQAVNGSQQAGNTASSGGLGPNDPWNRFTRLLQQGESEVDAAVKASTQGSGDRFVIGPYNTPAGTLNYIEEAKQFGGKFFDAGQKLWDQMAQKGIAGQVNRQVIYDQMKGGVSRIDISSGLTIDDVLQTMSKSWTAQEVMWIEELAQKFGYMRNVANTGWIKVP
jgi:RHS repeat-associated protein